MWHMEEIQVVNMQEKFSNKPESRQSSLGFYRTKTTYCGGHGLALTLSGLEPGFNDKAERRKIVLHGSQYIGDNYRRWGKFMGRSVTKLSPALRFMQLRYFF